MSLSLLAGCGGGNASNSGNAVPAENSVEVLEGYGQDVYSTYGGLVVNEKAEVLKEDGEPIENLYAAGELTCVQIVDPDHAVIGSGGVFRFSQQPLKAGGIKNLKNRRS